MCVPEIRHTLNHYQFREAIMNQKRHRTVERNHVIARPGGMTFSLQPILLLLFPAAMIVVGCSGSARYMTAYIDPDFVGQSYDTLSVHLVSSALDERKELEEALTEELVDAGIIAWESGLIFSPTRIWDSTQIVDQLRRSGVDAAIRIRESERWTVASWVPEREKTTVTKNEKTEEAEAREGDTGVKKEGETTTTTTVETEKSGGYMAQSQLRRFQVELVDLRSGRIAWTGSITIEGSNFTWLADRVTRQLRRDLMIAAK